MLRDFNAYSMQRFRARHPQPLCIGSKHRVVTTVAPESPGIPARGWF
jgi:hypothetical protein